MAICDKPIIAVELDFTGKESIIYREQYTSQLAAVMEEEYADEIKRYGGTHEFYISVGSACNEIGITDWDMAEFNIRLESNRYHKNKSE